MISKTITKKQVVETMKEAFALLPSDGIQSGFDIPDKKFFGDVY
jgi:hypothetical protein